MSKRTLTSIFLIINIIVVGGWYIGEVIRNKDNLIKWAYAEYSEKGQMELSFQWREDIIKPSNIKLLEGDNQYIYVLTARSELIELNELPRHHNKQAN